jgi:peptidoglycan/LPS O-acetylase OafA/YrhL
MSRPETPWRLGYIPALDGLRACAVGAVVMLHAGLGFAGGGGLGVDVFFVLSGFLITSLLVQEFRDHGRLRMRRFYMRRVLRLVPALAFMLAVTFALALLRPLDLPPAFDVGTVGQGATIAFLYLSDVTVAFSNGSIGPFLHTWSLSVEEHFYLLWPVALVLMLRRTWSWQRIAVTLLLAIVAIAAWRVIAYESGGRLFHVLYGFDTQSDHLLAGCLLAVTMPVLVGRLNARRRALGLAATAAFAGLALIVVVAPSVQQLVLVGYPLILVLSLVVVSYLASGPVTGPLRILQSAPFVYVGRLSYAIYLWHYVVFHALTAGALGTSKPVSIVIRLLVSLALAMLSYHVVEQRFLRLKNRRWEPPDRSGDVAQPVAVA